MSSFFTKKFREFCLGTRPKEIGVFAKRLALVKRRVFPDATTGLDWWIDPISQFADEMERGGYEPEIQHWLSSCVLQGECVLDVGANEGFFSVYCGARLGAARVLAFEPNPQLWSTIVRNCQLNSLFCVSVIPFAAGQENTDQTLTIQPDINSGGSTLLSRKSRFDRFRPKVKTKCVKIDDVCDANKIDRVAALKIDVEGFEREVLAGAEKMLAGHKIGSVGVEVHQTEDLSMQGMKAELCKTMESHGYRCREPSALRWLTFDSESLIAKSRM